MSWHSSGHDVSNPYNTGPKFHRAKRLGRRAELARHCMGWPRLVTPFTSFRASSERSEGSARRGHEMLRCAQHDRGSLVTLSAVTGQALAHLV